ncbi:MAG: SDR family NAD(P)-dependent oxidoreductase [Rhodospirillales bacterium]
MSGTCVIIGMGPGVSLALAERFGSAGYAIGMVARQEAALLAAEARLGVEGITAKGAPADTADEAELRGAITALEDALGPIEVLIYNAAAMHPGLPSQTTAEQAIADFRVNVVGALIAAQAVAPTMIAAGRGSILLTGGGFALQPSAQFASLGIGKAAIRSLAFTLAEELAPAGIRVGTVTICGMVRRDTPYNPAAIADAFFTLHQQRATDPVEYVFQA